MRLLAFIAALILHSAWQKNAIADTREYIPDLDKDGGYSIVEAILSQQTLFYEIDTDNNELLTLNELKDFMKNSEAAESEWSLKIHFDRMDSNKDKAINELEYLEKVANGFHKKDTNRDNVITSDEMGL